MRELSIHSQIPRIEQIVLGIYKELFIMGIFDRLFFGGFGSLKRIKHAEKIEPDGFSSTFDIIASYINPCPIPTPIPPRNIPTPTAPRIQPRSIFPITPSHMIEILVTIPSRTIIESNPLDIIRESSDRTDIVFFILHLHEVMTQLEAL